MKKALLLATALSVGAAQPVFAFCGFYVAQSGSLFNDSSKVVLARHGTRTAITMSSDVSGEPKDFALVIPVPTVIKREQVRVIPSATVDHLDSYSVPRLVEYFDPDPCAPQMVYAPTARGALPVPAPAMAVDRRAKGVVVEAEYSVGEYDIQVLSAGDSSGLIEYLNARNYRIPSGAAPVIGSYLKQNLHFFVAKVNLKRQAATKSKFLRPIQAEYESEKFMLPIRLGTVNARGAQDMIVLALTERGRVETTNYQTRRMPTGINVPLYVQDDFSTFYKAAFERQVSDADGSATFVEYAWNMGACDPCSAPPLSNDELRDLGASWVNDGSRRGAPYQSAFITRLHVRYDREHFPEDLALQETGDRESYQARYVVNHPFKGALSCDAGKRYAASLPDRFVREARNVVELTNWSYDDVKRKMGETGQPLER